MERLDSDCKILVPEYKYDINKDERFLIPFVQGTQIGFANKEGKIIIPPKFQFVLDDFDYESSLVRVGETYAVAYERKTVPPATYIRKRYGILKSDGDFLIPMEYEGIIINYNRIILHSLDKGYAVFDEKGENIVPFGKFAYIDGFEYGYARIRLNTESKNNTLNWGIIDEYGDIVLEPKYKYIHNFYGTSQKYANVEDNDGNKYEFNFYERELESEGSYEYEEQKWQKELEDYDSLQEYMYNQTYDEYGGSYAQDVMGYSDQEIGDAFDGDPDAYWNID